MPAIMLPDCHLRFSSYRYSNRDICPMPPSFHLIIYTHALSIIYTFFTYDIQNHIILYMTPHADTPCQFAPSSLSRWSHVRITSSVLCITLFR